jgi:hypothetical protein
MILSKVTTNDCECAEDLNIEPGAPCSSNEVIGAITQFIITKDIPIIQHEDIIVKKLLPSINNLQSRVINTAADILGCSSESCVITHPSIKKFIKNTQPITQKEYNKNLEERFKLSGPRNSLKLLSNYDIDGTLKKWQKIFPDFYHCPFAMMDFVKTNAHLEMVSIPRLIEQGKYKKFACVVNTDVSTGPGKHWVVIFVYHPHDKPDEEWTIEYFNSAGKPPTKPIIAWQEKTKKELRDYKQAIHKNTKVKTIAVTDVIHQESRSECGLYTLYYVRSRLDGVPYTFFENNIVPDSAMTAFRKHIFRDS